MLGNRVLTAIGASALNRSYGQPSLAHAQVSGLGLRLWRGLSSLPGAAIRARFASFSGRAVISFSAVPEASWRCASADCWAMRSGVLTLALPACIHHPTQDDQRHGRDHDTGSKRMAAAEPLTARAPAQTAGFGQRSQRMSVGTARFTRFADLIWC